MEDSEVNSSDVDLLWRCSCHGSHFINVQYIDWGHDSLGTLSLESVYRPTGFWGRVKTAWQVLTRGACTLDEVLVESPQVAYEIADAITTVGKRLEGNVVRDG